MLRKRLVEPDVELDFASGSLRARRLDQGAFVNTSELLGSIVRRLRQVLINPSRFSGSMMLAVARASRFNGVAQRARDVALDPKAVSMAVTRFGRRLEQAHPALFSSWCMAAAFGTYFCMYAFRKPFTAGTFENQELLGIGYKSVLVMTQVLGYALSKFIGIRVISEIPPTRRVAGILTLIGISELALLVFGLVPMPWNFVFLFFNGLPLGMVFGLVMSFLEGRRLTEALAAGLCASFIVSSGVVKSFGRSLILDHGVSEQWMPFLTGLLFVPPLVLSVWMLAQIPPPHAEDIRARSERPPMSRHDRWKLVNDYALGLLLLLSAYTLLTIVRSIRDDFGVEIWQRLGYREQPAVFAQSETVVMFAVIIVNGAACLIQDNRRAFRFALTTVAAGFIMLFLLGTTFTTMNLPPFAFMVLTGISLYVPYVAFHTTVFERLIAVSRCRANIGFLMYLADSLGYLGYIGIVLLRNFGIDKIDFLKFYLSAAIFVGLAATGVMTWSIVWFQRRLPNESLGSAAAVAEESATS